MARGGATVELLFFLAFLNLALIFIAFIRRLLKQLYFALKDRRRLFVKSYIEEALKEQTRGVRLSAPSFLSLAEEDFVQRVFKAQEPSAERLRGLYRQWGLAARRQKELQRRFGYRPGEAAIALARMGIAESAPEIARLLKKRNPQVRLAALRALEMLGVPEVADALLAVLPDVKDTARLLAAAALSSCCGKRPELLLPYLTHEDDQIRAIVAGAIAEVATPAVVPRIQQHAGDPNPEVRARITEALGTAADLQALSLLKELAEDQVWSVRIEAVTALGHLGDDDVLETLSAAVHDSDWRVRRAAAAALSNLAPEPLGTLTALRRTGDRYATEAMVAELERQGVTWDAINGLISPQPGFRSRSQLLVQELLYARAYGAVFYAIEMHPSDELRRTLIEMLDLYFSREDQPNLARLLESRFLEPDTRRSLEKLAPSPKEKLPSKFGLLLAGLGIGAIVTLLLAFKVGAETGEPVGPTS